jgi:ribose transport system permease protein
MNLQAHYQTFFTGVVVIGAVLLDMYRTKKTTEVRVLSPADTYKADMVALITEKQQQLSQAKTAGDQKLTQSIQTEIQKLNREMKDTYKKMKSEEKAEAARILAEEKLAEKEFKEKLQS